MAAETYAISGIKATIKKDPNSILDYGFDWGPWLTPLGDTLASVQFILSAGLTSVAQARTDTTATIFVSGGTLDATETITCRITTTNSTPRVEDRTVYLKIVQR